MTLGETTVVTAFYPLKGASYTLSQYKSWLRNLCLIPCHLVIFTTEQIAFEVYFWRKKWLDKTEVHVRTLDSFAMACPAMMAVWERQVDLAPSALTIKSPEFYAVCAIKQECVRSVILRNPFQSKYFVWCDAAIHRYRQFEGFYRFFPSEIARLCEPGQMTMLEIEPIPESFVKDWDEEKEMAWPIPPVTVGAGCMAGDAEAWLDFGEAYKEIIKDFLKRGLFCGKDTELYFTMMMERKLKKPYRLFYANRFQEVPGIEWLSLPPMLAGTIDAALDTRFTD